MVLMLVFLLFIKRFIIDTIRECVQYIARRCCGSTGGDGIENTDVREPIGNYWESLTGDD